MYRYGVAANVIRRMNRWQPALKPRIFHNKHTGKRKLINVTKNLTQSYRDISSLVIKGNMIVRYDEFINNPLYTSRTLALTTFSTNESGILYLRNRLQLGKFNMEKLHRQLLFCPPKDKIEASLDGVKQYLNLSETQLRKMVLSVPPIIGCNFDSNIKHKLDRLQDCMKLSNEELRKIVMLQPSIIAMSFDNNIKPKLVTMKEFLAFSDDEIKKMVVRHPAILSLNFANNIKPTLDAVQDHLDLSNEEVRKMLIHKPQIISYDFDGNIKPTLDALQDLLKLSKEELQSLVLNFPSIIGLNFNYNTKPKFEWLQLTFNLDRDEMLELVQKQGTLLGVNLEKTLIPNVAFWKECLSDRTDTEAMIEIIRLPREWTISHERLLRRAALFDQHNIPRLCLWGRSSYTDEKVDIWINKWVEQNCEGS